MKTTDGVRLISERISLAAVLACAMSSAAAVAQTTYCVNSTDPSCNVTMPTIQAAAAAALDGDTILVGPGTYTEGTIFLTHTITIRGEQAGVSGCSPIRPVFMDESVISEPAGGFVVMAQDVTIDGFVFQDADAAVPGGTAAGVKLDVSVSGALVTNCIFTNNSVGVLANSDGAHQTVISRNRFDSNNVVDPLGVSTGFGIQSILGLPSSLIQSNCFSLNANASIQLSSSGAAASTITIQHNSMDNGIFVFNATIVNIMENRIDTSGAQGVRLDGVSNCFLMCDSIINPAAPGVLITDSIIGPSTNIGVHDVNFIGCSAGALLIPNPSAYPVTPLNAQENWWDDPSGPSNATTNPGGTGGVVSDGVDIGSFLTTPTITIVCPPDTFVEATGPAGAIVNFNVTALSECDLNPVIDCTTPPGSLVPLGGRDVVCHANDSALASTSCTFVVSVIDSTAPNIICPPNPAPVECTGSGAAVVNYALPTATDIADPMPNVICAPPPGSSFPVGVTPVSCSATDANFNVSFCGFQVLVQDTTPPVISCPADITFTCTPSSGSVVNFSASAVDTCDPAPMVQCFPPSGSMFPVGNSIVDCHSVDVIGNVSMCQFNVLVSETARIIGSPTSQSVGEGDSVTFHVDAVGTTFDWRKGGVSIGAPISPDLVLSPVRLSDAGDYDCVVDNSCTPVTSNTATLTVHPMTVLANVPTGDPSDPNSPPGAPFNDPRDVVVSTFGSTPQAFVADFQHGGVSVLDLSTVPATFRAFLPAPAGFTSAMGVTTLDDAVAVTYVDPDNGSQIVAYSATSLATTSSFRISPAGSESYPSGVAMIDDHVLVVADQVRHTVQSWAYAGPGAGTPVGAAVHLDDPSRRFGAGFTPVAVKFTTLPRKRVVGVVERDSERVEVFAVRNDGSIGQSLKIYATEQLPQALALEEGSRLGFVTNAGNDSVTVIGPNIAAHTTVTDSVSTPSGVSVTVEDGAYLHLYVANRGTQKITHYTGPLGTIPLFFGESTVSRGSLSVASAPNMPTGNPTGTGDRIVVTSTVNDGVDDVGR
ncbi:MAG: HYR domain-containing protein [Planctomycetes bacterium]|nr:HYR domain-containing protein [Planctomycetota bacterium]MBI3843913.1 HYR domain-containing protein [Planctomycetota bacterium]